MADRVRGRTAPHLSLRRAWFRERVVGTLWFVPLCCAVAAFVLARVALAADLAADIDAADSGFVADRGAFGLVAATVATAMLTFLGVVFSTTLVAVQLAASQYSPRVVRIFVRSRLTQFALGVFLATFVVAVVALVNIESLDRDVVPALTMSILFLLVLATVGTFIAYLHGMVRLLRVQYLLRDTTRAAHTTIDQAFPPAGAYSEATAPDPDPRARDVRAGDVGSRRSAGTQRVLQAVDLVGLADLAGSHGCWLEICVAVGSHVGPRTVIARVHGERSAAVSDDDIRERLLFGSERTLVQDAGFGLRQLVDTASRALSPAINDPTTAVDALHRVVDLLERIAPHPDPTGWYLDRAGVARVHLHEDDFARLARLGFTEIILYGAGSPQVVRAVRAVLDELEDAVGPERRPVLEELRAQAHEAQAAALPPGFTATAWHPDRMGFG